MYAVRRSEMALTNEIILPYHPNAPYIYNRLVHLKGQWVHNPELSGNGWCILCGTKLGAEEPKTALGCPFLRKWSELCRFVAVDFGSGTRCCGAASIEAGEVLDEDLMEEGVYLNAGQRAIIAARMASRPGVCA